MTEKVPATYSCFHKRYKVRRESDDIPLFTGWMNKTYSTMQPNMFS